MSVSKPTKRQAGFYVVLAMAALSLATAIVYTVCYGGQERYMSWLAFVILLIGGGAGASLAFVRKYELGAACMAAGSLVSLLLYVKKIYLYVVVVVVGIDLSSVEFRFILCTALFAVCFIANLVTVFLPQVIYGEGSKK